MSRKRHLLSTTVLPPYLLDLRAPRTALAYKGSVIWIFRDKA